MGGNMSNRGLLILLVLAAVNFCCSSADENDAQQVSLTFVFDTTTSMTDELNEMKTGAVNIVQRMMDKKGSSLGNFILVPFNDPNVGPVTVTKDPEYLKQVIRALTLGGANNYDCPENSLTGIKMALESSLPGSYIYVITDASAKDQYLLPTVLDLVQKKRCQVVFIITGNCNGINDPAYQVYDRIKEISGGQIFAIDKNAVSTVLNYIEDAFDSKRLNLGRKEYPAGFNNVEEVLVDDSLKKLSVSVPAPNAQLEIKDPDGANADTTSKVNKIINLPNLKVVNIDDPKPGKWSITTGGSQPYALQLSGVSDLTFDYGFYKDSLASLSNRPIMDINNHLVVEIKKGADKVKEITSIEILSVAGQKLGEHPLKKFNGAGEAHLYETVPITFGNYFFYIAVNGVGENDAPFRRLSSNAIRPQTVDKLTFEPKFGVKPALEDFADEIQAPIGVKITMSCKTSGIPKPTVTWTLPNNEAVGIDSKKRIYKDDKDSLIIKKTINKDDGNYTCLAKNSAGEAKGVSVLKLDRQPVFGEKPPAKMVVEKSKSIKLVCDIRGTPKPKIDWYHWGIPISKALQNGDSIELKNARYGNRGEYKCVGKNKYGKVEAKIFLDVTGFTVYN